MQVGDWVEFQSIVVKQRHGAGSTPASRTLARKRRGMVIGERNVYDVAPGSPPVLTNRRPVLLVAVSLHRTYRVFAADVQPTTPPRPRRQRRPANAPAVVQPPPTSSAPPPTPAIPNRLRYSTVVALVGAEIKGLLARGARFTTCMVTQALRTARPQTTILYEDVFRTLAVQMDPVLEDGQYRRTAATCAYGDVWYEPLMTTGGL